MWLLFLWLLLLLLLLAEGRRGRGVGAGLGALLGVGQRVLRGRVLLVRGNGEIVTAVGQR